MEISPNVCPAIAVRDLGQLVVVVDHDLPVRMLSRAVHPHILLAFGGNVSFLDDLDVCFIAVKNFFLSASQF